MNRVRFMKPTILLFVLAVLCMSAGSVAAEEQELTWPVKPGLIAKDWDKDDYTALRDVGDVSIWNTRDDLYIEINPSMRPNSDSKRSTSIPSMTRWNSMLSSTTKGSQRSHSLTFKTDYEEMGIVAVEHKEEIGLERFEICWGVDPEKCPPNRYIIVHAELQMPIINEDGEEVWVDAPEAAFAFGDGVFERSDKEMESFYWGYYVTYPLAKVEPGHFIDANVNGLSYETPTQCGITGDTGQFDYIPGERVDFSVGSLSLGDALGDRRVSPMDLFGGADMDDHQVINVARLLQSLDGDGNPAQGAINITEPVVGCLESALAGLPPMPDTGGVLRG